MCTYVSFVNDCKKSFISDCKSDAANCKFHQHLQSTLTAIQLTVTRGSVLVGGEWKRYTGKPEPEQDTEQKETVAVLLKQKEQLEDRFHELEDQLMKQKKDSSAYQFQAELPSVPMASHRKNFETDPGVMR